MAEHHDSVVGRVHKYMDIFSQNKSNMDICRPSHDVYHVNDKSLEQSQQRQRCSPRYQFLRGRHAYHNHL
ncbi:hypothetical protein COL516b_008734 [Colletotrichum fioriniae]|nr:uncharacterized protein COL516b_008734 [Colletotrichum fioriniae]KAJ0299996.1 hypothetical protein COL516b_008734 [Colletotrichum fioriniae]